MSDEREVQPGGPSDRLVPWAGVRSQTGLSRTTAWRLQNAGDFPRPVRISARRVGWWQTELDAWKAGRSKGWSPPHELQPVGQARAARPCVTPTTKPPPPASRPAEPKVFSPPQASSRRRRPPVADGQIAFDF